jgi:hypothetical protein
MARSTQLTWEVLQRELARLKKTDLLEILALAFDALPQTRHDAVFGEHVDLAVLVAKPRKSISGQRLLQTVQQFHSDSLKRRYYEGFNVNSRNFMEKSEATRQWVREVNKLFEQCVTAANKGHHRQTREAMDLLFDLLHRVDDGEDFVFFADEQGSWQVGVEFEEVFPVYFAALAATADPPAFADRALELISMFERHNQDRHLRSARKAATPAQKQELRQRAGQQRQR